MSNTAMTAGDDAAHIAVKLNVLGKIQLLPAPVGKKRSRETYCRTAKHTCRADYLHLAARPSEAPSCLWQEQRPLSYSLTGHGGISPCQASRARLNFMATTRSRL